VALLSFALAACSREQPAPQGAAVALLDGAGADATESAGQHAEFELERGQAELALGRLAEAGGHFEAALALDTTLEVARGALGLVRLREGRTAPGLQLLRQACAALGPENSSIQSLLTGALDASLWAEAETLAIELLRASPDDPLLHFVRGRAYAGQQRYPEAARDFARAAELQPTDEVAPVNEAHAYMAIGDEPRAAATLRAAHERMPESRLVMQRLAWLLATANDDSVVNGPLAKELALRVLAATPKSPEYLTLTAAALAAAGEFTPAVIHEKLALEFLAGLPAEVAPPQRDELTAAMRARLAEYQAQRRWREEPRTAARTE